MAELSKAHNSFEEALEWVQRMNSIRAAKHIHFVKLSGTWNTVLYFN